jgi:hypothetical protein
MHTLSGRIAKSWLLYLCLMVLGISLTAIIVITINILPIWKIVLGLVGVYGGMLTIAMIFLFALVLGVIGEKK